MAREPASEPRLRLVGPSRAGSEDAAEPALEHSELTPLRARAAERFEPWPIERPQTLAPAHEAALRRGIRFDVAVGVVVERRIALEVLARQARSELGGELDRIAGAARAERPLWGANSDYLRMLLREPAPGTEVSTFDLASVGLPARLAERIPWVWPLAGALDERELALALRWEIAALLAGATLTEWALETALGLCRD